jgi:hypothetical protein
LIVKKIDEPFFFYNKPSMGRVYVYLGIGPGSRVKAFINPSCVKQLGTSAREYDAGSQGLENSFSFREDLTRRERRSSTNITKKVVIQATVAALPLCFS